MVVAGLVRGRVFVGLAAVMVAAVSLVVVPGVSGAGASPQSFEPTVEVMAAPPPQDPFCGFLDNPWNGFFSVASCWLLEQGITNGTSLTTYGPDGSVSRAQMAAFLWRAAGSPVVSNHVFVDEAAIPVWAREATDWLKAEGITTNDPYRPAASVTRAEMAAFLWRASGRPAAVSSCGFVDAAVIPLFAREGACWLKANRITTNNPYNSAGVVNRAQMAAFLWREAGSPAMSSLPDPSALVLWMNTRRGDLTVDVPLGVGDVTINWGDDTPSTVTAGSRVVSHTYANPGYYRVVITGLLAEFGGFENSPFYSAAELVAVSQFGNLGVTSLGYAFSKAPNLTRVTQNLPASVDVLQATFSNYSGGDDTGDCTTPDNCLVETANTGAFRNYEALGEDIAAWDTSGITDMSNMFEGEGAFNVDISAWDTSNVTTMKSMFDGAEIFNQDLSGWNVSNVTNMYRIFATAREFQSDLSAWDVSNVVNAEMMFQNTNFNGNVDGWNFASLTNGKFMFERATRSAGIDGWTFGTPANLGGEPVDLSDMFIVADMTGQLTNWDMSNVVNTAGMFFESTFNGDISYWDTSSVTSMELMFVKALNFNQDLSSWDVSKVINKRAYDLCTPSWVLPKPNLGSSDLGPLPPSFSCPG